ncbi:c-type cytochrome [Cupriavidus gilardii]|nr:c-type cytochrome [Cupriavidus gilardii]
MKNNNPLRAVPASLAALAMLAIAPPSAAEPTIEQARDWAAACASCHGPSGRAPAGSPVPGLAGRPQSYLIEQMQAFKTGKREATVMHQIAKGYTDEQIAAMAKWFAAVK